MFDGVKYKKKLMALYDVSCFKGLVVIGKHGCGFTQRAVTLLTNYRIPFYYLEASSVKQAEHYHSTLHHVLSGKYRHETQDAYEARGSPTHHSWPIVLENGVLLGGCTEVRNLLTLMPEEAQNLRMRLCRLTVPVVALPAGDSPVPSATLARVEQLVRAPNVHAFRYITCQGAFGEAEHPVLRV